MPDGLISPDEMDALMDAVRGGQAALDNADHSAAPVASYDFARPARFSKEQTRALNGMFATFARSLGAELTLFFRTDVEVTAETAAEASCSEMMDVLAPTDPLAILRLDPLPGRALLSFDTGAAFAAIDRLLGGGGKGLTEARELTELELGLMGCVIDRAVKAAREAFGGPLEVTPSSDGFTNLERAGSVIRSEARVVLARFLLTFGAVNAPIYLAVPVQTLEPVIGRLRLMPAPVVQRVQGDRSADDIRTNLNATGIDMVVELGRVELTVRDLLDLQAGDLVCLNRRVGAGLDVRVGDQRKFLAQPGQIGRRLGVTITDVVDTKEKECQTE